MLFRSPPSDEIVMVAGTPPIRATKVRYFEDARFQERILTPPDLVAAPLAPSPSADDWSGRVVAAESRSATDAADEAEGDPANAGIRREPELGEHEEIVPPTKAPEKEFDFDDNDPGDDAARDRRHLHHHLDHRHLYVPRQNAHGGPGAVRKNEAAAQPGSQSGRTDPEF